MNNRSLRRGSLASAAALVLTTLAAPLLAAPALAAPGDGGTVTVTFVDQYGRPVQTIPTLVKQGDSEFVSGQQAPISTATFTGVAAGGWSLYSVSGWGGLVCSGVSPCASAVGSGVQQPTYSPVITVADDTTTTFTQVVPVPTIGGGDITGSALSVQLPQGFPDLQAALAGSGQGVDATPSVQWQRGSTPIAGAPPTVGVPYTTVTADGGQALTARLTPNPGYTGLFARAFGAGIEPLVTNAITMRAYVAPATKTKVKAPKSLKPRERATLVVKVTSAAGTVTGGTVQVKVAKVVKRATVVDGKALVTLPGLARGLQKIKVSYAGAATFAPSKAKPVKIKVG